MKFKFKITFNIEKRNVTNQFRVSFCFNTSDSVNYRGGVSHTHAQDSMKVQNSSTIRPKNPNTFFFFGNPNTNSIACVFYDRHVQFRIISRVRTEHAYAKDNKAKLAPLSKCRKNESRMLFLNQ